MQYADGDDEFILEDFNEEELDLEEEELSVEEEELELEIHTTGLDDIDEVEIEEIALDDLLINNQGDTNVSPIDALLDDFEELDLEEEISYEESLDELLNSGVISTTFSSVLEEVQGIEIEDIEDIELDTLLHDEFREELMQIDDNEFNEEFEMNKQILEGAGFLISDEMSPEDLDILKDRYQAISDDQIGLKILTDLLDSISKVSSDLATTKATYTENTSTSKDIIENIIKSHSASYELNSSAIEAIKVVLQVASRMDVSSNKLPSAEDVYEHLVNLDKSYSNEIHRYRIIGYLEEIIPKIVESLDRITQQSIQSSKYREQIAKNLMSRELRYALDFRTAYREGVEIIKQIIFNENGESWFNCAECGSFAKIENGLADVFIYSRERRPSDPLVVPIVNKCSCGKAHVLTSSDLISIAKGVKDTNKSFISIFNENSSDYSKGTSIIRLLVVATNVKDMIPSICVNAKDLELTLGDEDIQDSEVDLDNNKVKEFLIDNTEMEQAVKMFYRSLEKFSLREQRKLESAQPEMESGILKYEDLAYYVCRMLGKDYKKTINQAIFSVVYYFNDNPYFKYILNREEYWDLKNNLVILEDTKIPFEAMGEDVITNLSVWYEDIVGESSVGLEPRQIIENLREIKVSIEKQIKDIDIQRAKCMTLLEEYKEDLCYTPIINLSSYNIKDFNSIMCDDRIANLVTEMAHRMILTNYSKDFFEYWRKYEVLTNDTIKNGIIESTSIGVTQQKLVSALKSIKKKNVKLQGIDVDMIMRVLDLLFRQTVYDIAKVNQLYKAMRSMNYYRFCEVAMEIDELPNLKMNNDYTTNISKLINMVKSDAKEITSKSEYAFYLSEFSTEELELYEEVINTIEIGRYVLKRLDNESVLDYVERFKQYSSSLKLNSTNSYDNWKYFEKYSNLLTELSLVNSIYSMSYERFSESIFMAKWFDVCVKYSTYEQAIALLGTHVNIMDTIIAEGLKERSAYSLEFVTNISEYCYRLSTALLYTSVESIIKNWARTYFSELLVVSDDLNAKRLEYDIRELVWNLFTRNEEEFINPSLLSEDNDPDKSDAVAEVLSYCEEDKDMYVAVVGGNKTW